MNDWPQRPPIWVYVHYVHMPPRSRDVWWRLRGIRVKMQRIASTDPLGIDKFRLKKFHTSFNGRTLPFSRRSEHVKKKSTALNDIHQSECKNPNSVNEIREPFMELLRRTRTRSPTSGSCEQTCGEGTCERVFGTGSFRSPYRDPVKHEYQSCSSGYSTKRSL